MDTPPKPILTDETTKQERKRRKRDVHVKPGKKVRIGTFKKRYATVKRKAEELETLCDTEVCLVCFGPDGKYYTLPEEKEKMKDCISKFRCVKKKDGICEENVDLLGYLEKKKKKFEGKKNKVAVKDIEKLFESWNAKIPELGEKALVKFYEFLEKKIQIHEERCRLLEEEEEEEKEKEKCRLLKEKEKKKGKAIQLCDDGESGLISLKYPCSVDLYETNNLTYVNQQSCNSLLSLGSSTHCPYNQRNETVAANYGSSTWPLDSYNQRNEMVAANYGSSTWPSGNYTDMDTGSSSSNGTNSLLRVSDSNTDFGIPEIFDLMAPNNNNILMSEINNNVLPGNDFLLEFAKTGTSFTTSLMDYNNNPVAEINSNVLPGNDFPLEFAQSNTGFNSTGFGIPMNFDSVGYNNNSIPMAGINSNTLPNREFPLKFAQTNMGFNTGLGIPENINMTGYNCNMLPNNGIPLEFANTSTSFGTLKKSDLMGESNNNFFLVDHGVTSQLSQLHYTVPRSVRQSSDGNKSTVAIS